MFKCIEFNCIFLRTSMLSSLLIAALFGVGLAAQVFPYKRRNYSDFFWHAADFLFFSAPILTLSRRTSVTTVTVGTRFSNNNAQEYPATMKGFFESYLCIGNFISPFHWSGSPFCQDGRPEGNGDRYASLRKFFFGGDTCSASLKVLN